MWWSRRAALLGLGALAGCGFAPVYGPGGAALPLRGAVAFAAPEDERGFHLVGRLEERLGRAGAPAYELSYAIAVDEEALAIDGSNNVTRWNLEGAVLWALRPGGAPEAEALVAGEERAFTAYSAAGAPVGTLVSARDAERRLMVILADRIVARLLAAPPPPA